MLGSNDKSPAYPSSNLLDSAIRMHHIHHTILLLKTLAGLIGQPLASDLKKHIVLSQTSASHRM